ncbi:CRE-WRT-4.1 protein [Aphelenchoides avenae]|nr:CRE-WRT-4.1 protein [Aphelenchus avenae]
MSLTTLVGLSLVLSSVPLALASFCGPASVPFSFEALPSGQPVLGCARPTCFGWSTEGSPAGPPATFYRVNKKPDGYFRKTTDAHKPKAVSTKEVENFHPQTAQCAATFESEQCPSESQWVGGIGPLVNISGLPLAVQCCEYEPLRLSQDRGVAVVNPGQIVIGGEVINGERQYAFDYISDIVKHTKADGSVSYDVSVRRLPCLPYPPEFSINVDESVNDEIVKRFVKVEKSAKQKNAVAFQAPIQIADNQIGQGQLNQLSQLGNVRLEEIGHSDRVVEVTERVPIQTQNRVVSERVVLQPAGERVEEIQGPFVAENDAVVEEVSALEGFELPAGQVPQGIVNPAPVGQAPAVGYYPAAGYPVGGGGGGGGGSLFCFTADTKVRLGGGEEKRMDELTVGDWVLSANRSMMVYSPVESWVHRLPEENAHFHRIELDNGSVLKITSKHFIYKTECSALHVPVEFEEVSQQPVFAEKVEEGDCLYVVSSHGNFFEQRRVVSVSVVEERGIYAPMTSNGDIVVNDVLASCYNVVNNKFMQEGFFQGVKSWPSMRWFFGSKDEEATQTDLPTGITVIVDLLEHVLPKNIYAF